MCDRQRCSGSSPHSACCKSHHPDARKSDNVTHALPSLESLSLTCNNALGNARWYSHVVCRALSGRNQVHSTSANMANESFPCHAQPLHFLRQARSLRTRFGTAPAPCPGPSPMRTVIRQASSRHVRRCLRKQVQIVSSVSDLLHPTRPAKQPCLPIKTTAVRSPGTVVSAPPPLAANNLRVLA